MLHSERCGWSVGLEPPVEQSLKRTTTSDAATAAAALRQLSEDMLGVSADGRKLAIALAISIREIVNLQCDAVEACARISLDKANDLAANG